MLLELYIALVCAPGASISEQPCVKPELGREAPFETLAECDTWRRASFRYLTTNCVKIKIPIPRS